MPARGCPVQSAMQSLWQRLKNFETEKPDGTPTIPPAPAKPSESSIPSDAPPAPKEDGKVLKSNGQVIAKSKGGQWVAP